MTPRSRAWSRRLKKRYDDKFSHYFTAEQLKQFEAATSGRFTGVGLAVTEVPKGLRVADVFPDTPAEEAGLEDGRRDRRRRRQVDRRHAPPRSRPPGSRARPAPRSTLRVEPADGGPARDRRRVERADVRVPAVDGRRSSTPTASKIAYVAFATFSAGRPRRAARRDRAPLPPRRRGPDPRPARQRRRAAERGGAVRRASSSRRATSSRPAAAPRATRTTRRSATRSSRKPTVVLINRDTASAAEILTAALQQNDLADRRRHAHLRQGHLPGGHGPAAGGALDLTIGEYLTADGTSILGEGVKPDVRVEDDPARPSRATRRSTGRSRCSASSSARHA